MADRFDLDAIEADDALLDLLAAGGESARAAGEHDPAVALLAELRLAVEVEDELPVETIDDPESFLARCAALNPITDPFARKVATRGLALSVAAVAALSVSGVAAAVTGDPLSPYEKVIEKMVDAVRPQTSFPKEQLDGLPVVDRTKIVKVAKDYKKVQEEHAAQTSGNDSSGDDGDPQSTKDAVRPPLVTPEKPLVIFDHSMILPTDPPKTQEPVKSTDDTKTDTQKPTDTTSGDTGSSTTDKPTTPPDTPTSTPPPTDTTTPPGDTTTTPTPTDTTTTTPPASVDTGSGDNTTSSDPTATPSSDSGTGQTDTSGTGNTAVAPGDGSTTDAPAGDTTGSTGTSGTDTTGEQKPASDVTQAPTDLKDAVNSLLDQVIAPVLPTPTGEPVTNESAERFFGVDTPATVEESGTASHKATAKHSSGKVTTGSVRRTYATGKHSTGQYAEGRHAAIARTYGATDDASLLQILDVVNKPTL